MILSEKNPKNLNIEKKLAAYLKALEQDKNNVKAIKDIAFCYKYLGENNLAIRYFSLAKNLTPFDKDIYYELGKLEYSNKNYIKAIKLFMRAIKLSPNYIEAIIAMGEAHEAIEEFDMAEMIYLKILEKTPKNTKIYEKLGFLYIKTFDYKKAQNCFSDILAIDNFNSSAYFGLAKCFDETGKIIESKRYYKKCLSLEPFSERKNFILSRLNLLSSPRRVQHINCPHLRVI